MSINTIVSQVGAPLSDSDYQSLALAGIDRHSLDLAGWRRVTHAEARDQCGIRYKSDHLEGIAIPYRDPRDEAKVVGYRVRRDHPEVDSDGKGIAKYLSSPDRRHLYFAPDTYSLLADTAAPCIVVEAEKSVLSIMTAESGPANRQHHLLIGTSGCWGWRGITGKATAPDGTRVDEKGVLPDLDLVTWTGRDTIIVFDSNVNVNTSVQAARRALAAELERRGAVVRVVDLPIEAGINGPDDYIGRHGGPAFFALVDAARPWRRRADDADGADGPTTSKRSQASELIDLAADIELWHAPTGDAFGTIEVDGHREHHPLRRVVRDYLSRRYFREHQRAASSTALTDATATLMGMARFDGAEHPVSVRLAHHDDALYLDLGGPDWRLVQITRAGWQVVTDAPVRHWRPASLRALPTPTPGGHLDALRDLWPMDDDTWSLVVCWLVSTSHPTGPYPVLVETGEQGSGKSTLGRMLRGLIDPASPELRGVPRDERDVMIGALSNHVLALDNLSGLPAWLSDALCRIATGGGLATRTLYSDLDETLIDVCRPILLTGIDQMATRGDLLDRSLVVTLPALHDHQRRDEADLWQRYHAARPALVGALLDAAVCALRRRADVVLDRRPRMADAAVWVTAAEPALGWPTGRAVAAWLGAREVASAELLAGDAVATSIMSVTMPWSGTATDLLDLLGKLVPERTRQAKSWPASARSLSGHLRRLAPDLRRAGIDVQEPTRSGHDRSRVWRIVRTVRTEPDPPENARETGENPADGRADGCGRSTDTSSATVRRSTTETLENRPKSASADGADGADGHLRSPSGVAQEVPRARVW